jgi:hypothetical protein
MAAEEEEEVTKQIKQTTLEMKKHGCGEIMAIRNTATAFRMPTVIIRGVSCDCIIWPYSYCIMATISVPFDPRK